MNTLTRIKTLPLLFAGFTALVAQPAQATVSLYAEYHLGEGTSLGTAKKPQDSTANAKHFATDISGSVATVGTTGLVAPGSTACLDTSGSGDEGWYSSTLFSSAPSLATDNFAFGVYASAASGAAAYQGDVFTVGGSNGSFKLSLTTNGWGASAHNMAWIGPSGGVTGSFAANTWVHLAMIRSAGVTTFYINGVAQSGTYSVAPVIDSPHIAVSPGGGGYFDGRIDEARVVTFTAGETAANILSTLLNGVMVDPVFSPVGGNTLGDQSVAISTTTPGATIYYTIDGSTPTTSSAVYSSPIALTAPSVTTIKAIAVRSGLPDSAVVSQTYSMLAGSIGVWTNPAGGSWTVGGNWDVNAVPSGAGLTADFGTLDLAADGVVTLDGARTIGHLVFGDTTPDFNWSFNAGSGGPLTLATTSGTPSVTVNNQTATVSVPLVGTQGLTTSGTGKLVLTGSNSYSGGTTVNAGSILEVGTGGTTGTLGTGNLVINGQLFINRGTSTTISLPSGAAITGSGSLRALGNIVRLNGNITLGGAITLEENGSANTYYEGLELASSSTLTASAITLTGNLGKQASNGNDLILDTSAANGPITMNVSTGLGNVWYIINSLTANAGTGTITIPGVGIGGPWASGLPSWLAPTSLRGAVQITGNVSAGAPITIETTGPSLATGGFSGAMSLTKNGSDTLTLQSYSNTYTGTTTVNGGTLLVNGSTASASTVTVNSGAALGGLGFIDGAVTVNAGGSLSPGDSSLGTLAIGNILTLNAASTVVMEINKDGGLPSSDLINGLTGALTYAGTLTVNDTTADSTPLALGDKFTLFTKASGGYGGAFATIHLPTLPVGLRWETGTLLTDGSIEVQSALVAAAPVLSLGTGTYVGQQLVSISAEPGAEIHYTTDGGTPTASSPLYTGPVVISVNAVTTLRAIAILSGYTDSNITSATYTVWSTPIWLSTADESWHTDTNWTNNFVPDAGGLPADFHTLDLTADVTVDLGGSVTIGNLVFGDTDPGNNWILGGGTLTLAVDSGTPVIDVVNQTTTLTGALGGTQGLVKTGDGILSLDAASNSYSGPTTIDGGTLIVRGNYVSNSFQIASGAVLDLAVASGSSDRSGTAITGSGTLRKTGGGQLWWYGGATNVSLAAGGLIDVQGGTLVAGDNGNDDWASNQADLNVATGAVFNGRDAEVHVNAITGGGYIQGGYPSFPNAMIICGVANGSGTFSGSIGNSASGACPFTKTGTGTQKLTGSCTFTGATSVEDGALIVNGSLASGSAVSVTGGVLGGTGSVNGTVQVGVSGALSPGDDGIGTLHAGATTLAGTYTCGISDVAADVLAVTGNLNLTGSTLAVSGTSTAANLVIATYSGSLTGTFTATPALPSGYSLDYSTPGQIKLTKPGYDSWAVANGVTGGPTGDSDNDGIKNLVEYALNLDPSSSDGSAGTVNGLSSTYTKRTLAVTNGDVRYIIETSSDLSSWTPVLTQGPGDPGYEDATIGFSLPDDQTKLFQRLRVESIP